MNNLVFNTVSSRLRTLITNETLTVAGSMTLTGTASVEIANTTLTVSGDVEITNTTLTVSGDVTISGHLIAETDTLVEGGTGVVFADTDISQVTTGSFFVYNRGASPFTVSLQVSPVNDTDLYVSDPENDDLPVPADAGLIIAVSRYGRYARLLYEAGAAATFSAYYIGQM